MGGAETKGDSMRAMIWVAVAAGSLAGAAAAHAQARGPAQASWRLALGPEEKVDLGLLNNAPNGHISYESGNGTLTVWVAGRLPSGQKGVKGTQGTFALQLRPPTWDTAALQETKPTLVFQAPHNSRLACDAPEGFYRDYAAVNSVIPGPQPGELLGFVHGEFHPLGPTPKGLPLLASIGVAISTDGLHWSPATQVIQGQDAANRGCGTVAASMTQAADNEGAAGPSAVVREDGGQKYVYVYYADRIRLTEPAPTMNIYVARAPYSGGGVPRGWQKWTGSGWIAVSDTLHAAPVVTTPKGAGESAHPEISYNAQLHRWLMVFHTTRDLYAASSADGLLWDAPQPLGAAASGARKPAFPTLITESEANQETTGGSGWLYYSRNEGTHYVGYRRTFTLSAAIAHAGPPTPRTPRQACLANGGFWSGGRCH